MKTLLALSLFANQALAWGNFGHQVIGELASHHLCAQTNTAVLALLNGESLAEAATWADEVRELPEYKYLKPWHYVTMELGSSYSSTNQPSRGDLVSAYHEQSANLRNPLYPNRAEALRLLIHFVGDAHQPFHAGRHADGGGNGVILTWFGYPSNLHKVWDTGMIKKLGLSVDELANLLNSPLHAPPDQLAVEDWVKRIQPYRRLRLPNRNRIGLRLFR